MWLRRCLSGISALLTFIAVANAREWTDSTGKYRYEAEFIELKDGNARLKLANGTTKSVPLEKLSPADQKFAQQPPAITKKKTATTSPEVKADATSQPTSDQLPKDALAKEIEKSVVALGYPKATAADLTRLARDWKCELWKQKLSQARAVASTEQTAELARIEEEAAKALYQAIGKDIGMCVEKDYLKYFNLSKVVRDKKSSCLGFSQVLYILGNSIGLNVRVIDVLELVSGPLPSGQGHVACLVSFSDGKVMMVDIAQRHLSRPFVFKDVFAEVGNYWERKQVDASSKIHRRIQILNENGLVGCLYTTRGNVYGESGQETEAISAYTRAIKLNPKFADAYFNRGNHFGKLSQDTKAISDYSRAIEINPKYVVAYYNRGSQYSKLRQDTEAISSYTKAIALNPKYADAYCNRGNAYGRSGHVAKAISDYIMAIQLDPTCAAAYCGRGNMYDTSGQHREAITDYDKAIGLNPKYAEAYNNRGIAYNKTGQEAEAISDYTKAIEVDSKYADAYFNRGSAYGKAGQHAEAMSDYTKAIEANPAHAQAYCNRGIE